MKNQVFSIALCALTLAGCMVEAGDEDLLEEDVVSVSQAWSQLGGEDLTKLCVAASDCENCGTSDNVKLQYYAHEFRLWECTITETIPDGGEKCCTPTETTSNYSDTSYDMWRITFSGSSDDGLKMGTLRIYTADGDRHSWERFDWGDNNGWGDCSGYSWSSWDYAACWLDGDGNGDCDDWTVAVHHSEANIECQTFDQYGNRN